MINLSYLLRESGIESVPPGFHDPAISGISINSNEIKPGWLFVAIKGFNADGHNYIDDAILNGALAIIGTENLKLPTVPYIKVQDSRSCLSRLSAVFYDYPAQKPGLHMVGITGTNGKSSTAVFTQYLLEKADISAGLIGTICYHIGKKKLPAVRTTPESHDLQKMFRQMRDEKNDVAVMEVSSHALELSRVEEIKFHIAAFTNLSAEHLDFHTDMENYFQAKSRLFTKYLRSDGSAIFNLDDTYARRLFDMTDSTINRITVGSDPDFDWNYRITSSGLEGIQFNLKTPRDLHEIRIPVVGEFNVSNAVMAAVIADSVSSAKYGDYISALSTLPQIPGRLERISDSVFVDYAHSPDALEKALHALAHKGNTLTVVFGAGGDRDRDKRPMMGRVAAENADDIIITNDNPRSENPEAIAQEIAKGIDDKSKYQIILDRREAIKSVLLNRKENEVVIIAGKGHENYQEIQGNKIAFSDAEVVREYLQI